jgi:UDP-N-acetylmuramoyl-tripeptide--D-alanyl-D-alanine ligase
MSMGRLSMVAEAVGGRLYGPDVEFDAVSTDTRSLQPGQLFFALRGARADGGAFVAAAARLGAAGAVVEARQDADVPQVEVADTRLALGEFGRRWREGFNIPLIGITGSNGKTTVKEMTAAIMRAALGAGAAIGAQGDPILMTWGNLNNEIGLPRTLLYLNASHQAAVLEMGGTRPGDIAYLARIAAPTVAVVTNAARAHLQGFGSIEDVAATKGEIFAGLPASGTAVINRDDRFFQSWWERSAGRRRLSFGLHAAADFRASAVSQVAGADGVELHFTLHCPAGDLRLRLAMAGRHNVVNALAAAAASAAAGATLQAIAAGLGAVRNVAGRLRRVAGLKGICLYDDTYNANPGSVRAAIAFLESLPGERWLVLGDMAELGPDSLAMHREMGELARRSGAARLYCAGPQSKATAEAFGANAEWCESVTDLAAALQVALRPGLTVLVKGSRSMGMERVVQALAAGGGAPHEWGH